MDSKSFEELLASAKEAKEILSKKRKASRSFFIEEPNAKVIRKKFNPKFCIRRCIRCVGAW